MTKSNKTRTALHSLVFAASLATSSVPVLSTATLAGPLVRPVQVQGENLRQSVDIQVSEKIKFEFTDFEPVGWSCDFAGLRGPSVTRSKLIFSGSRPGESTATFTCSPPAALRNQALPVSYILTIRVK